MGANICQGYLLSCLCCLSFLLQAFLPVQNFTNIALIDPHSFFCVYSITFFGILSGDVQNMISPDHSVMMRYGCKLCNSYATPISSLHINLLNSSYWIIILCTSLFGCTFTLPLYLTLGFLFLCGPSMDKSLCNTILGKQCMFSQCTFHSILC